MTSETRRSPSSARTIAVLGLGRMGAAVARRLAESGHDVVGWSRSGRVVDGVRHAPDPGAAAAGAEVVLLCLFDGPACREVLQRVGDRLRAGAVVVNTSTVAPGEAVGLAAAATAAGARYLHAPVMGSIPSVRAGTLTLLVGGDPYDDVAPVLTALGHPLPCGSVADAAALKLLANGALGSSLLSLRDCRRRAAELGVRPSAAWDVLERTALGGLVRMKRDRFEGGSGPADFTVAALAKDLALLAEEAPSAGGLHRQLLAAHHGGAVAGDSDVAGLVVADASDRALAAEHRLFVAPGVTAPPEVLAPLRDYVAGHATGDPTHHRAAFLPSARVEGLRDGAFVSWGLDDYCDLFPGRPADDEPDRRRTVDEVSVRGTVATATMTLLHGRDVFVDLFLLVRTDDGWRIASKIYERRAVAEESVTAA